MFTGSLDHLPCELRLLYFLGTHIRLDQTGAYGYHTDPFLRVFVGAFLGIPHDKIFAQTICQTGFVVIIACQICLAEHMPDKSVFLILCFFENLMLDQETRRFIGRAGRNVHNDTAVLHIFIKFHVDILCSHGVDHDDLFRVRHCG